MPTSNNSRARRTPNLQAALVARRFYLDGQQKSDIADEFGISRFKVARLLDAALESGIVRIYVDMPADVDVGLGEKLASTFSIGRALVADVAGESAETAQLMTARLAADFVMSTLGPDDVLGISWGTSVQKVVDEIDALPPIDIVQMVGGVRTAGLDTNGSELVRRLSHVSGGEAYPLLAPLIVDTDATVNALRGERAIAEALAQFVRISVALVGIGSWSPEQSSLIDEVSDSDRRQLIAGGAVADVCGLVLTSQGTSVDSSFSARTLSISFDQLARVPKVVAIAGGLEKTAAIEASVNSGLIDILVTDSMVAERLLGNSNSHL